MSRIDPGDTVPPRELPTLTGETVPVPDPERLVHLQFRRYAGCPVCNLHLRGFALRHEEIAAAGIREIAVFHSDRATLEAHGPDLPFDVVPDPGKRLYTQFRVERSLRAVLHPGTWWAAIRGWSPRLGIRSGPGGHLGLPADFLIDPRGTVVACAYGSHANDHWSIDRLLTLAEYAST